MVGAVLASASAYTKAQYVGGCKMTLALVAKHYFTVSICCIIIITSVELLISSHVIGIHLTMHMSTCSTSISVCISQSTVVLCI